MLIAHAAEMSFAGNWRSEKVVSASYHERPKESPGPANHHGVKVNTDKGNSYLIHNTPNSGVVATNAAQMGNQWSKSHDIPVNGHKTVQDVMSGASARGGHITGKLGNYLTSGTCIGAAGGAEKALKN